MEKVVFSETDNAPSSSFSETRLICRVCQKQFSQYTCPRCNTRYCSLECYKRHSHRCTESFMQENVSKELHQIKADDSTKREMLEILKRVHAEDNMDSEGEEDNPLFEEAMRKISSGHEIKPEDLSPDELNKFRRALASGELSKLIEPWDPWWNKPSAASISLSPSGNQLIRLLHEEENADYPSISSKASICEVPAGPENPLPPLRQLTRSDPSPLLPVHLIDIIYSYCFTLRLYNGDWHFDPLASTMVVLTMSSVLGSSNLPETVSQALATCLERTCSPEFRHSGGFKFGLAVINDSISLLSLGANAIICLLCDLGRLIRASEQAIKSEQLVKLKRSEISRKLKGVERKIYYLTCWVHEQPEEVWSSLVSIMEVEKASVLAVGQGGGKRSKGAGMGCAELKLVEEV